MAKASGDVLTAVIESPNVLPQLTLSYIKLASKTTDAPMPRIRATAHAIADGFGARGRAMAT